MRSALLVSLLLATLWSVTYQVTATAQSEERLHIVQAGDTWLALSLRYGVAEEELRALNPHFNTFRQPSIGRSIVLPPEASEQFGLLQRANDMAVLRAAIQTGLPVWRIASLNGLASPYLPTFYRPLLLPSDGIIRDLPAGISSLELSREMATPGRALGLRGNLYPEATLPAGTLDGLPISFVAAGNRFAGVVGTGAFYAGGEPELVIFSGDGPAWIQPWAFSEQEWEYQELTLTGPAAEIDQQAREEERARLRELWSVVTPAPAWKTDFATPLTDFLSLSANYGARRSYNGGPYLTYHEGVDYSAYAGTIVTAPAAGVVVLAEPLFVRGGAVIIDHGLGVFTGYYHLSAIHASAGQQVAPGDILGEVGTTGLSTGNHLHWDLLINGIWVDAAAWQAESLACWLLDGIGQGCDPLQSGG